VRGSEGGKVAGLKLKADWRQLPLLSVIGSVHNVLKLQMTDLRPEC